MSTQVETQPVVQTSQKVVRAITKQIGLVAKTDSALLDIADAIGDEAARLGLTEKQRREFVVINYLEAANIAADSDDAKLFIAKNQPQFSRIMILAFPKSEEIKAEIESVREHNKTATPLSYIPLNSLYEIARGNETLKSLTDQKIEKEITREITGPKDENSPDPKGKGKSHMQPLHERLGTTVKAVFISYLERLKEDGLTEDDALDAVNEVYAEKSAETEGEGEGEVVND